MAVQHLRLMLLPLAAALCLVFEPFGTDQPGATPRMALNAFMGLAIGYLGLVIERNLRRIDLRIVAGGVVGLFAGAAVAAVAERAVPAGAAIHGLAANADALRPVLYLLLAAIGMLVGAAKADRLGPSTLHALFRPSAEPGHRNSILDTSVIIDGRIADICAAGFLDDRLLVPQFILRELQQIADSTDPLKRNRGRKGLDILQRMKKMSGIHVEITDLDFPGIRDVDQKLIELARRNRAKIVTNDLNLNKVARLHGIEVLSLNELASALKPSLLPGETMSVFVTREGKEPNQGVAYLEDGTMIVVDHAREHIGRSVDIVVTSSIQTTAGRMFFGRCVRGNGEGGMARPHAPRTKEPVETARQDPEGEEIIRPG